jgi:hypothetical protein
MSAITSVPNTGITASPALQGEPATADEIEQVQWAEEAARNAGRTLLEGLRQLITLNTALLAGSAAFLSQLAMPKAAKGIGAGLLLISLVCALWGSVPREIQVCPYMPSEIKRTRETVATRRLFWLKFASLSLALAFAVLLLGLALG